MADLSLSGLASGLDTASVISQLMAIERQGQTRVQYRQKNVQAQATGLKDVKAKLEALKSAAVALRDASTWKEGQSVETSDAARVGVTRTGGAPIGGYGVRVTQLAASAQKTYSWTEQTEPVTLTLDDGDPATDAVGVAIGANAKITDVAAAINGRSGSPVYAAVVGGDKLVLSSRATGEDVEFSATGTGLGTATNEIAGKDAKYYLDGDPVEKSSPTNTVADAIPGLTLSLKGTTSAVSITVGAPALDQEAVKAKVRSFVEAYNAVVTLARNEVNETKVTSPTSNFDAARGALFGDSGLTSMLSKLRSQMGEAYSGVGNAATLDDLTDIGVSSGKAGSTAAQAKSGLLRIDETKLADAIANDSQAVRRLFGGGADSAFAQDVETMVDDLNEVIDARVSTIDKRDRRITEDLARAETRLQAREKRLKAQFTAMETALSSAQTQQSWLTGQLAALNPKSSS